jgi:hypothetical protein
MATTRLDQAPVIVPEALPGREAPAAKLFTCPECGCCGDMADPVWDQHYDDCPALQRLAQLPEGW